MGNVTEYQILAPVYSSHISTVSETLPADSKQWSENQVDTPRRKKAVVIKECRMRQKSWRGDERRASRPFSSHSPGQLLTLSLSFFPTNIMWPHLIFIVFFSAASFSVIVPSSTKPLVARLASGPQQSRPVLFIEFDLQEESIVYLIIANRPGTLQII